LIAALRKSKSKTIASIANIDIITSFIYYTMQ